MPDLGLSERRAPTHIMWVEVPLDLSERSPDFDAVADALRMVLAISRAALSGEICADPQVTMDELTSRGQSDD
jgi:hypothetical protein